MKKIAVIVAGGSGQRMGTETPKQFLLLNNMPVLWHTINSFLNAYSDLKCIVVLPKAHIIKGEEIKQLFVNDIARINIVIGGETRFHSVQNGLKLVEENSVVFVHDGVRCLVNESLIKRCYNQCIEKGSAIPAVAATDSIRILENTSHKVVDRNNVMIIQTPQTFQSDILLEAFNQPYNNRFTDEATVVEATGKQVYLCEGDYNNIKITRPLDLLLAERLMTE
ncbi:MAG: 2-C-methyl-D-erythritol 4-phosphate cytidylyltransferase [Chitinophagaceae bacterium]